MFPVQIRYTDAVREIVEMTAKATQNLSQLHESDVEYGTAPKEEVYREDNVVLYRYKPVVEKPYEIPLLIVYALVNRPYMVDLQENRSLVRNLLALGLDVHLIDWGYPKRNDRWITIDDHVNSYIANCVDVLRERNNVDKVNLLGICQASVREAHSACAIPRCIQKRCAIWSRWSHRWISMYPTGC